MSNRRTITDFPRNEAGLVDEFIGTAYDTVKNVFDNLGEIQRLDDVLAEIPTLADTSVGEALAEQTPAYFAQMDGKVAEAQEWADASEASKIAADNALLLGQSAIDAKVVEANGILGQVTVVAGSAQLSVGVYPNTAAGIAATTTGKYFSVPSSNTGEYLILYLNNAGAAVEIKRYPSAEIVQKLDALVKQSASEVEYLTIVTLEAATLLRLTEKRLATTAFTLGSEQEATIIGDKEGATVLYSDSNRTQIGPLNMRYTTRPGLYVTTPDGEILQDLSKFGGDGSESSEATVLPFEGGLLFGPTIAMPAAGEATIFVNNLLSRRERVTSVHAAIGSGSLTSFSGAATEGTVLKIKAAEYSNSAVLHLRAITDVDQRMTMPLKLIKVPQQSGTPLKVLIIGDSIVNRQGAQLTKSYLTKMGFAPTMVGTLRGSANASNNDDMTGEYGEGREGWETGDYTGDIIDRLQLITPGTEAAYMAMTKAEKQRKNPMLRAATGSDPDEIIRNGYVMDMAFYQTRFGLETPDVVINALGTNNVRDRSVDVIADQIYADDILFYRQVWAAWPNARIVRSLPGTAFNNSRNNLWTTSYTPMIKAMRKAINDTNNSKIYLAPTWALVSSEVGYPVATAAPNEDGFIAGNFLNFVHPEFCGRQGLYEVLASYVAAAALNL